MPLLQKGYLGSTPLFKETDWFEDNALRLVDEPTAVTVTANTAANTKGTWSQIIASTTADASYIVVQVTGVSASSVNTATLLDLATGASGSEVAFASNIAVGSAGALNLPAQVGALFAFPLKIASGTRISARIQSVVTGGKTAVVRIWTMNAGDYDSAPASVDVIGGNTANSQGTSFSGSSGTWVQATASTSQAYRAIVIVLSGHNATLNNAASTFKYSVGVGASGSEVEFGSGRVLVEATENVTQALPYNFIFGRKIPSGSRLAVRHEIPADSSRVGFVLIGIP